MGTTQTIRRTIKIERKAPALVTPTPNRFYETTRDLTPPIYQLRKLIRSRIAEDHPTWSVREVRRAATRELRYGQRREVEPTPEPARSPEPRDDEQDTDDELAREQQRLDREQAARELTRRLDNPNPANCARCGLSLHGPRRFPDCAHRLAARPVKRLNLPEFAAELSDAQTFKSRPKAPAATLAA